MEDELIDAAKEKSLRRILTKPVTILAMHMTLMHPGMMFGLKQMPTSCFVPANLN